MFGRRKPKQAEVLQHWIAFVEGFQSAPSRFYDGVEEELKLRQVPGMEMARVEFAEGSLLSDKRLYLRMTRERLVFDVCAAPFGTGFFFSCRMAEIPAVVRLWQLALLFFAGVTFWFLFVRMFGLVYGNALLLLLGLTGIYVLRNAVAMGLRDLDATLIKSPALGPVYEAWFRKETYFRHDTRLMYLEIVSSLVKKLAEDAVAAKGAKLVRQYEQAPILGELYKPVPTNPESADAVLLHGLTARNL